MRLWPLLLLAGCDGVLGLARVHPPVDARSCFTDPFTGDTLGSQWNVFEASGSQVMVAQHDQLEFHYIAGARHGAYNNITSVMTYDFTTGYVLAELVQPPPVHRETSLRLGRTPTEYYDLDIRYDYATDPEPTVSAKKGDSVTVFMRPFNPVQDRWFRVSIDGAVASFETSPDGVTWTGQQSPATVPTNALTIMIDGYVPGMGSSTDPASDVYWDNVAMLAADCAP